MVVVSRFAGELWCCDGMSRVVKLESGADPHQSSSFGRIHVTSCVSIANGLPHRATTAPCLQTSWLPTGDSKLCDGDECRWNEVAPMKSLRHCFKPVRRITVSGEPVMRPQSGSPLPKPTTTEDNPSYIDMIGSSMPNHLPDYFKIVFNFNLHRHFLPIPP